LSVSDIAARMGSSYFTLKRYERGAEFPSGKMLLKWVDVLGFKLVVRHKKSAASATERHKPSYRSVTPLRCPTITYVQLSC
jgi:ribosome-binding protein aMBF1 (putative translation factor)